MPLCKCSPPYTKQHSRDGLNLRATNVKDPARLPESSRISLTHTRIALSNRSLKIFTHKSALNPEHRTKKKQNYISHLTASLSHKPRQTNFSNHELAAKYLVFTPAGLESVSSLWRAEKPEYSSRSPAHTDTRRSTNALRKIRNTCALVRFQSRLLQRQLTFPTGERISPRKSGRSSSAGVWGAREREERAHLDVWPTHGESAPLRQ